MLDGSDDPSAVIHLLSANEDDKEESAPEWLRQAQEKSLRLKIEELDAFSELCSELCTALIDEIEKLSKESPATDNTIDS